MNDLETIEKSVGLILKEKFQLTKVLNQHFLLFREQVYVIGFGEGPKTEENSKGIYCYWAWYKDEPYGALTNANLKTKFDSIDYYQTCQQNAEDTINKVLNEGINGKQTS